MTQCTVQQNLALLPSESWVEGVAEVLLGARVRLPREHELRVRAPGLESCSASTISLSLLAGIALC